MALADIRRKIEDEAALKAETLLKEAKEQAGRIRSDAEAEIERSRAQYAAQLEAEAPEVARRAAIMADLDVRRLLLGARQELIGQSFDGALDRLLSLGREPYLAFMEKLLDQAVNTGDEELLVASDEKHLDASWLESYNTKKGQRLTLSDEHPRIRGGFILRRGRISENCSLETLVRWLRDDLESDLTARLFAQD